LEFVVDRDGNRPRSVQGETFALGLN